MLTFSYPLASVSAAPLAPVLLALVLPVLLALTGALLGAFLGTVVPLVREWRARASVQAPLAIRVTNTHARRAQIITVYAREPRTLPTPRPVLALLPAPALRSAGGAVYLPSPRLDKRGKARGPDGRYARPYTPRERSPWAGPVPLAA